VCFLFVGRFNRISKEFILRIDLLYMSDSLESFINCVKLKLESDTYSGGRKTLIEVEKNFFLL